MASWNTLPPEIHDTILSFFCHDIIAEYTHFDKETLYDGFQGPFEWPKPPSPLINFSAAFHVNHSFRDSLLRLKINGTCPSATLQSLQKERCDTILDGAADNAHIVRMGEYIDIGVMIRHAGIFWKNPLVREAPATLLDILRTLKKEGLIMLIPHLEDWVLQHATPRTQAVANDLDPTLTRVVYPNPVQYPFKYHMAIFRAGSGGSFGGHINSVSSVNGISEEPEYIAWTMNWGRSLSERSPLSDRKKMEYKGLQKQRNAELIKDCPVFEELGSSIGEWWLYVTNYHRLWVLVDYQGKRMWANRCQQKICYWIDIWDLGTWKVGEKDAFGKGWFLY